MCDRGSVIERSVAFGRPRLMRCGCCHHQWLVTEEWLDRFSQGLEGCPICGTDCRSEARPEFWATPEDPLYDDSAVRGVYWYHSSTHENWPIRNFDPAASLTKTTKQRMERSGSGVGAVERWAERQKAKALHVGTYEAAIENLFRRMNDQGGAPDQFYLHRLQLTPSCVIEPGIHREPTDFMGDACLADVCAPGTNVLRYVNVHEDPSSVSLAIEAGAIQTVQTISIPLPVHAADPWVISATSRLAQAASEPARQPKATVRGRNLQAMSALSTEARTLESEIAARLPLALRARFGTGFDESGFGANPASHPMKLAGLVRLVTHPQAVLDSLDAHPSRVIS